VVERRSTPWLLALAALLSSLSLVVSGSGPALLQTAAAALTGAALWIAAACAPRPARRAWLLLTAGLVAWVVGDAVYVAYDLAGASRPPLSLADVWYLAGYPLLFSGIARMARLRAGGLGRESVLDALALALGVGIVTWELLIQPSLAGASSPAEIVATAAYPFGDVFLLAAGVWLAFADKRRSAPTHLLLAFFVANLTLDATYSGLPLWREEFDTTGLDALYPICYALLAAAAAHPAATELTAPAVSRTRLHPARIVLLGIALVLGPIVVALDTTSHPAERVVVLGVSLAVAVIVLLRFAFAVRDSETAHAELAHRVAHDELTGLVNRELLLDRIEHALERTRRTKRRVAVLYVDLDRYKPVNDTWGHRAGDLVLVEIAERLRGAVRPGDTVARVGGDEFVVLCEELEEPEESVRIAERIVLSIGDPIDIGDAVVCVTGSVGIALGAGSGDDRAADDLLRDADAAMYRAKDRGRDRWELYDWQLRDAADRRRETEAALQSAVARGQLRLAYQPIIRLSSGTVSGFEALVRWQRPSEGLVSPDQFIALAEETGLILPIGEWVLGEACRQLARWNRRHPHRDPLDIAVNVSGRQLNHPGFARTVARVLRETGVPPHCLTLEVTESVLVRDGDHAIGQLDEVKRLGVRIAVDDFGTGYSALAYLRRFAIDVVKIDRVFMEELGRLTPDTTVVAAVIRLAQVLGHEVVAEGAETADQMAALYGLGCDFVQGFYFAPPLARQQADALVDGPRSVAAVRDALQRT
jgi:diguanylate cyclase (GGDEF)-like protein